MPRKNLIVPATAVMTVGVVVIYILLLVNKKTEPVPVLGKVSSFELTNQDNVVFNSDELKGKVYLVNFFFTSCKTICPVLSRQMVRAQRKFKRENFHLLSISVDPDKDTPEKMKEFAGTHSADLKNWDFLTGDKKRVSHVIEKVFKIAFPEDPLAHGDRFILVDGQSQVRGYFALSDEGAVGKMLTAAQKVMN